ncbi:hypothetical protein [Ferruginibacter albus]|uniref:hypothetical protein n=1 Tax=Ferruginibacter albus TaxID=2875540 RepID=UPI001CC368D3|nr:hypothetical protein [Ferruginibacter albus]UAY50966.1 hypothetical protein K9M53_10240 [Ferruginibacter albus]
MHEWSDFYVATAGAAAALTGLIFVGVSINLSKILELEALPERAMLSLTLLMTILILSLLSLVPQPITLLGIEILLMATIALLFVIKIDRKIFRKKDRTHLRQYIFNSVFNQLAVVPYFIGGIFMICTRNGIYWIVAAIILSFIKAVLDAWVLLVEINR